MPSVRRHLAIDAPVDVVWRWVGDPGRLHEWFPVVSTEMKSPPDDAAAARGALSQRWITLASGMRFAEDVVTLDHDLHRFQYRIVDNPIVTRHLATVDVLDDGPRRCIISYATDMEPGALALVIAGAAGAGLERLKGMAEAAAREEGR